LPVPPRSSDLQAEVLAIVEELKEKPGHWAIVNSYPDDPAKAHRRREAILKYGSEFLDVTVLIPDVYARYTIANEDE
jgi:hypothetical protein